MPEGIRSYGRLALRLLDVRTEEEREKRANHAFALLLVAGAASVKHVTGLTPHDAPFTLYLLAIAGSAARGGLAPALVAALASILLAGLGAVPPLDWPARLLFGAEGVAVALVVAALRSRVQAGSVRLRAAEATIADLKIQDRRGRLLDAALRHLEDTAGETAVVVLNEDATIAEWRTGAQRLYGHSTEDLVGASVGSLFFDAPSPGELSALLRQSLETGWLRRTDVHRRRDGGRVDVELEIKPFRDRDARGFTLTVHDLARCHEWDEYRREAASAQAELQEAANDTRRQLAALESLTDPSLNPFGGAAVVTELLERLRASVRADGAALVQPGPVGPVVVAARGLQPVAGPIGTERPGLTPGRVAVVHNDRARVEQLSALRWPRDVSSLLVVPVVHNGQVWSAIEVVSERSRQVSDWDVALVRVVADRLAAVVVHNRALAAKAS